MDTKRPCSELSSSNEELLASGLFADVAVQCEGRKWKLHRNILSTRCEFFRKALEPDRFKESTELHIEIREQHADKLHWVIYFIYTGRLPGDVLAFLEDKSIGMQTCIELFEIADYFSLFTLRTHARDVLLEHMVKNAGHTQSLIKKIAPQSLIDKCVDEGFVGRFFQAVKTVYSIPLKSFDELRDVLLMYPELTRYAVVRTASFRKRLLEDPEFTNFAMRVLGNAFRRDVKASSVIIPHCEKCPMTTEVIVSVEEVSGRLRGHCRSCQPLGNINVMQDLGGKAPGGPKRQKT